MLGVTGTGTAIGSTGTAIIVDHKETVSTPDNRLIEQAGVADAIALKPAGEEAWIEVIQKMDAVYAELVHHQVELERQHAALEEAQHFIGSVLSAMTDILIVCDRNGVIERVNQALERLTGRRENELQGARLETLFAPESAALVAQFQNRLESEHAIADCEVSLIGADGNPAPLAMNCSSRYDHKGRLVGVVIIGRPVGELRRAYENLNEAHLELRQAQQQLVFSEKMAALGRLVAGVAHELNNPISFVFGNMHALKRYGDRLTRYLQAIDRGDDKKSLHELRRTLKIDRILTDIAPLVDGTLEGAERVSEIVQDLRRFSSTQTEPSDTFDLCRVTRTAVSWVVKAARVKPEVVFALPSKLEIAGRRGPLHQIVVNLVQNAVDILGERDDARIDVSARVTDDKVTLSVRDNGPGLSGEVVAHMFEPFFTTKPIGEGTGLGLYVSYGLANELGGRLGGANAPGGGAVFTLDLPNDETADG